MTPISLTMERFRSFSDPQTFVFPQTPGLYFMQGVNEAEPALEGNAAGKSSTWEALCWVLFERTSEGLKAGDVCHWDFSKGTRVVFVVDMDGHEATVTRTWKPNTWTLTVGGAVVDLAKEPGNPVLARLRCGFLPFLQTVFIAQATPMFLDLKSEPQANLFSEVLGLDFWTELSSKASEKARAQDSVSRQLEQTVAELRGRLQERVYYKDDMERFEIERGNAMGRLEVQASNLEREMAALKAGLLRGAGPGIKARREKLAEERRKLVTVEDRLALCRKEIKEDEGAFAELQRDEDKLLRALDKLKHEDTCPTCGQGLSVKQRRALREDLLIKLEDLDDPLSNAKASIQERRSAEAEWERMVAEASKKLGRLEDDLRDDEQELRWAEKQVASIDRTLDDIEEEHNTWRTRENPFKVKQRNAATDRIETERRLDAAQRELERSAEKVVLYSHWVKGFKEVRLQQIADALSELELEANSELVALGLDGWALRFDVDRETKGGTVARGFSVAVQSPTMDRPVPWAAWCGGERQRLRLAAQMGLANQIRARMGVELALEVWDEPSRGLSPKGVTDLLAALERRAIEEGRPIWVVEHTASSYGGFTGRAIIRKTAAGSQIEQL